MRKVLAVLFLASLFGCTVIDTGHRGVRTDFGKIVGEPVAEGLYWYWPLYPTGTQYVQLDVQEQTWASKADSFTKDQQRAMIDFTINYYPDPDKVDLVYHQFGQDWAKKNLEQFTLQAIKDVVGQTAANDLVQFREKSTQQSFEVVRQAMANRHIFVTSLKWTNIEFDDAYEKAVEAKVVQLQRAQEAHNKTIQIEEEAKQKVIAAEAEAKAMQIKSDALSKNERLVNYEAVLKWNGVLPQYMLGSAVPFIDIKDTSSK